MDIVRLIEYFRIHQDHPRDIHMLVSDPRTVELLDRMRSQCPHSDIHVYCPHPSDMEEAFKDIPARFDDTRIEFCEIDKLTEQEHPGMLLFDEHADHALILKLSEKEPQALVGLMRGTNTTYLRIWEAYRESCMHIYLRYRLNNDKLEVLDWTKNKSGIELSVIFPVYNVGKYLEQCIQSISAWKAPYVEYLFVNDGSPDNSRDIILLHAAKDPRIKLIDKPNGGCASARQKGLSLAQGRYIGFIDPDDYIDPDMFRQLLSRALLGNYETCWCGYNEYYESTGTSRRAEDALDEPYASGTFDTNMIHRLILYQRIAIWRGIYSRELLDRAKISFCTELRRFDDLPFKVEVCAQARSAVCIKQYLYYYRLNRPGQDVSCNDERLYVHFDIFRHLDKVFDRLDNRKLRDYLQMCKIQTHAYALSKIDIKFADEYCRRAKQDLSRNCGIFRTVLGIKRWLGGSGIGAYLAIMLGKGSLYKKHLEKKGK